MPPVWKNNLPPQPSPGDFPDDGGLPSSDARPTVNQAFGLEASVVLASMFELLEEQRHEAEMLLERHHLALSHAIERIMTSAKTAVPVAEILGPAEASKVEASTAAGAAGTSSTADLSSGAAHSANAVAPVAEAFAQAALPKVDASKVKPAAGRTSVDAAREDPSESAETTEASAKPQQDATPPADSRSAKDADTLVALAEDAPPQKAIDADSVPAKRRGSFIKRLRTAEGHEFPAGSIRARLSSQMNGPKFEALVGCLILANTLFTFMQLELDGLKVRAYLYDGDQDPGTNTKLDFENLKGRAILFDRGAAEAPQTEAAFKVLSATFAVIFLAELVLKLYVHRCGYFRLLFNIFDFVIVVITSIDAVFKMSNLNFAFLRTMRILRLARVFGVIRTMNVFTELRVLMKTIILSFRSMIWSMLILFIFMLVGSLLLCGLLQEYVIKANAIGLEDRLQAFKYFGTPSWALYSFFEVTFSGCWPTYAQFLIYRNPLYAIIWVPYVLFVVFTLIRIIYALLLKDTMQAAASDADDVVRERTKQTAKLTKHLKEVFHEFDHSGDGHLSREEFTRILAHRNVRTWMQALGVDTRDEETLFDILDDGDGELSINEFVEGILRTKGQAQQQHMLCNMRDNHRILEVLRALRADVREVLRTGERPSTRSEGGL